MKKILMVLIVTLCLIGCGEKYDKNHSKWFNEIKNDKKTQLNIDINKYDKSQTSIIDKNKKVSPAYYILEIFKGWMIINENFDEELNDLDKLVEGYSAKYDKKANRIYFEFKSNMKYSGYMETFKGDDGILYSKKTYLYYPTHPAHDDDLAKNISDLELGIEIKLRLDEEFKELIEFKNTSSNREKEDKIDEVEKKEDIKATEKPTQISVYDKHNDYSIKIKAEGLKDIATLSFDETENYVPYLGVYTPHPNNPNDFQDVEYINLIYSWSIEKTGQIGFTHLFKLKGDKIYPLEFGEGDFGVAFLVEDEDGVYPVVVRYGNKPNMGNVAGSDFLYPDLDVVKFQDEYGKEFLLPSEYLINSISTNHKMLTINYANGSTEKYTVSNLSEYYYVLKEVK